MTPEGYPTSPKKNELVIINKEKLEQIGAKYYYASVYREGGNVYTTSSRAMGVIGVANDLESAEKVAEQGVGCINGKLFYRKDIGTSKLLQKRIDHMNSLLQ